MKKQTANLSLNKPDEKENSRYIFSCVANILYVAPCIMCLAFGVMTEGFNTMFLLAFIAAAMAIPVAFAGLFCYKQHKGRGIVLALAVVQLVLHIVTAVLVTTWYLILAPAFILTLVLIANSKVIENH